MARHCRYLMTGLTRTLKNSNLYVGGCRKKSRDVRIISPFRIGHIHFLILKIIKIFLFYELIGNVFNYSDIPFNIYFHLKFKGNPRLFPLKNKYRYEKFTRTRHFNIYPLTHEENKTFTYRICRKTYIRQEVVSCRRLKKTLWNFIFGATSRQQIHRLTYKPTHQHIFTC